MGLQKRYLKSRQVSKVTFRLPRAAAPEASQVALVGEFNDWSTSTTLMTRLKNGEFKVTVDLEPGREYEYRYLIEDMIWENDWEADGYRPSGIPGTENSVVVV